MRNLIEYLKFLARSSNQHGVHSPFVYRYVTECLYAGYRLHHNKSLDVLLKSIAYFSATHLLILGDSTSLERQVGTHFPNIRFGGPPYDLLYVSVNDTGKLWSIFDDVGMLHNNSLLILDAPHSSNVWEQLKAHPMVRVTLDLFYCGVVFVRKEQAKEHFKIRI